MLIPPLPPLVMPLLAQTEPGSLIGHFTALDWVVMLGYLVLTTVLGGVLAGRQANMRDFFLGGRSMPWYAVAGSMVATEISAITFVSVPSIVFAPGGNFTYMQLGLIGGLIARFFVAFVLVPAYYKFEIYSPYDYMGNQLGGSARGITTALFSLGGLLAQASRVYLTAIVLELVMKEQLTAMADTLGFSTLFWAVVLIGVVSVGWTVIGGIATVIWTDVMLFLVFVTGGIVALGVIVYDLPGGFAQLTEVAGEAGKFRLFDLDVDFSPTKEFTIWTAAFATVFGNVGAYGTDQLMAQRIFTCKNAAQAKLAVIVSWLGQGITAMMLLVGAGLYAYYTVFPERLVGEAAATVAANNDKVFPVFILTQIPPGLTGLIIAGIFAAAISSMTSILAALSQTTMSSVYLPLRAKVLEARALLAGETAEEAEQAAAARETREGLLFVSVSRLTVLAWGVALCVTAFAVAAFKDANDDVPLLNIALGLAGYVQGGLLGAFLLAYLPMRVNGYGLVWSAPLSVFSVLALRFHEPWAHWVCGVAGGVLIVSWVISAMARSAELRPARLVKTVWLALGVAVVMGLTFYAEFTPPAERESAPAAAIAQAQAQAEAADPAPAADVDLPLESPGNLPVEPESEAATAGAASAEPAKKPVAFPWYPVVGGTMAFVFGYLLGDPVSRREDQEPPTP